MKKANFRSDHIKERIALRQKLRREIPKNRLTTPEFDTILSAGVNQMGLGNLE